MKEEGGRGRGRQAGQARGLSPPPYSLSSVYALPRLAPGPGQWKGGLETDPHHEFSTFPGGRRKGQGGQPWEEGSPTPLCGLGRDMGQGLPTYQLQVQCSGETYRDRGWGETYPTMPFSQAPPFLPSAPSPFSTPLLPFAEERRPSPYLPEGGTTQRLPYPTA